MFIYRCPRTGLNVQGSTADAPAQDDEMLEPVSCPAGTRVHRVNP
jgi:hypothetical protein